MRTDIHRVGAIIPADYQFVLFYALSTTDHGWPIPSFNIDLLLKLKASVAFASHGSTGKCTVCGALFIEGSVWKHIATGEHIHIGHQCADKYALRVDWTPLELARDRQRIQAEKEATAERNLAYKARQLVRAHEYLDAHPGLREDLAVQHDIIVDIATRFFRDAVISPKQEALVRKLAHEARNPAPVEVKVPAPVGAGRITFRGVILSVKEREGWKGNMEWKMTVKVTTEAGVWLAWGTCDNRLSIQALEMAQLSHNGWVDALKGAEVEITATLQAGSDPSFAFFKRPKTELLALKGGV